MLCCNKIFHKDVIDTSRLSSITTFKMDTYVDPHPSYQSATSVDASAVVVQQIREHHSSSSSSCETRLTVAPSEEVPLYKLKVS